MVLASYSMALMVVSIAAGRVADIVGRKIVFIVGCVLFSLVSMSAFWVSTWFELFITRSISGVAAGLILASAGGLFVNTLHGNSRHDARLLFRGAGMAGLVLGPVLGPWVQEHVSYQQVSLLSADLLVAAAIVAWSVKESRDKSASPSRAIFGSAVLLALLQS